MVEEQSPATGFDLSVLSLSGERTLRPFLHTSSNETHARFSPDGRFVAYASDESGRVEVYVTPYPGAGARWQVSTDGGEAPVWSRDGRELFHWKDDKMMTVSVETRPAFRAGVPKVLFELSGVGDYDVAPDGQRFVMARTSERAAAPRSFAIVLGWLDDLSRRVAAARKQP